MTEIIEPTTNTPSNGTQAAQSVEPGVNSSQNASPNRFLKMQIIFPVVIGGILLIIMIALATTLLSTDNTNNTVTVQQTTSPSVAPIVATPTQQAVGTTTQIENEITNQTKPQLDKLIEINYEVTKIKTFEGNSWAILEVSNPTTDPARVIAKKENGVWKVILGPGTYFDESDLRAIGAPPSLYNEL